MWSDLPKGVLYMHSFKTHFSSPAISYINAPTGYLFTTTESWTVCFHTGLFLNPVWHSWVLGQPLNGSIFLWQADSRLWITTRLADEFAYGFSCFVWHVQVKKAPMVVISLFLVKTLPFVATWWLPTCHPLSHPIGVLVVLATPVKAI